MPFLCISFDNDKSLLFRCKNGGQLPEKAATSMKLNSIPLMISDPVSDTVSEAFVMELLETSAASQQATAPAVTPLTDSLSWALSLGQQTLPSCSAKLPEADVQMPYTAVHPSQAYSNSNSMQAAYATAPWLLCICLLCSTMALAIKDKRRHQDPIKAQTSSLDTEESFCIRSKLPMTTPMKYTGCSPFVPVTQAAMPPPAVPQYHLPPSCSSKIGSYRTPRGAKPTASRALSTQTSTSGRTKWQRDRNGRLASLAAQKNDSPVDEFTSLRAKKKPNLG